MIGEYRIVIIVWFCLIVLAVSGCGANFDIELQNKHFLAVMNSNDVMITPSENIGGDGVRNSVARLNLYNEFVFGIVVEPDTREFEDYFLLNTSTGNTQYFSIEDKWLNALNGIGITSKPDLLRPTSSFHRDRAFIRVKKIATRIIAVVVGVIGLFTVFYLRRIIMKKQRFAAEDGSSSSP
jgi:hypothetical protein